MESQEAWLAPLTVPQLAAALEKLLRSGSWPAEGSAPSVRSLAAERGISPTTARKVLARLVQRGVLIQLPGSGRYALPGTAAPGAGAPGAGFQSSPPRRVPRHRTVAEALREDILSGALPPDRPLPGLKQMQGRFGCGYPSLRVALQELQRLGLVRLSGRYLHPVRGGASNSGTRIHLACDPDIFHRYQFHSLLLITAADRALRQFGWHGNLKYFLTRRPLGADAPPDHLVAGYVYIKNAEFTQWREFFLQRPYIPLVVLEPAELLRAPRSLCSQHVRSLGLTCDNRRAGRELGAHLRALGHQRIAFFSHQQLERGFGQLRLAGLREHFPEAASKPTAPVLRVFSCGSSTTGAVDLLPGIRALEQSMASLPGPMMRGALRPAYEVRDNLRISPAMERAFAGALEDSGITAWVGINDAVAALAWNFLLRRGIAVPGALSVAGFDNSPLAIVMNLTSYDFGFDSMGHLAVECIARPHLVPRDEDGWVRAPGSLVVRDTTAAPGLGY